MSEDYIGKEEFDSGKYRRCIVQDPGEKGWIRESEDGKVYFRIPVQDSKTTRKGVWRGYLTEKAQEITMRQIVRSLPFENGWDKLFDTDAQPVPGDPLGWAGLEVEIELQYEEYNGEPRYRLGWLNAANGGGNGGDEAIAPTKAKSLISRLKGVTKAVAAEEKTVAPKVSDPAGQDDDIPF